jgi:hypothetical protein
VLALAATRPAGVLGGWLGLTAGAWFVIGPAVSLTWERGPGPIGYPLYGPTRQTLELLGYFYGLGVLILALSAFAIGRFASRPPVAERDSATAAPQIATEPAPAGRTAAGQERSRRRLPFSRRGNRTTAHEPTGSPAER